MNSFEKQPSETYPIKIDFSESLESLETVASHSVVAYLGSTTTTSVISSTYIDSTSVYVKLIGGVSGLDYKITVIAITSTNNSYEEDVIMKVREL